MTTTALSRFFKMHYDDAHIIQREATKERSMAGKKSTLARLALLLLILIGGCTYLSSQILVPAGDGAPLVDSLQDVEGRIAFVKDHDTYTINADGSDMTQLTTGGTSGVPRWLPDGTQIAFGSREPEDDHTNIFTMQSNGNDITRVITRTSSGGSWSPDGTQIAFMRSHNGQSDLYVMDFVRNTETPLGIGEADSWVWSPDSTQLAFVRYSQRGPDIFLVDADGSNLKRLTTTGGRFPAWSPDGKQIAFSAPVGGNEHIYTVTIDSQRQTRRTSGLTIGYVQPRWSPDGVHLAFSGYPWSFFDTNPLASSIYKMNVNNGMIIRLTSEEVDMTQDPVWSPDGRAIAFNCGVPDERIRGVCVTKADGSMMALIAEGGSYPSWQP